MEAMLEEFQIHDYPALLHWLEVQRQRLKPRASVRMIADRSGLPKSKVMRILAGTREATVTELLRICIALKVDPREAIGELYEAQLRVPRPLVE